MASFASSATTCGARKHAWTKISFLGYPEVGEKKMTGNKSTISIPGDKNDQLRLKFPPWVGHAIRLDQLCAHSENQHPGYPQSGLKAIDGEKRKEYMVQNKVNTQTPLFCGWYFFVSGVLAATSEAPIIIIITNPPSFLLKNDKIKLIMEILELQLKLVS